MMEGDGECGLVVVACVVPERVMVVSGSSSSKCCVAT